MKIAFITDLHLGADGEKTQGVDVRQNFLQALGYLEYVRPDCLVIGGDICNSTGDRATYTWVKNILDALPFSYYIIAGNHDESTLMAEAFNLTHHLHGSELYYALPLEGCPALFLDTAKGILSPTQWTWLREYIIALRDNNLLVFMHHPPLPADVTFMDAHHPFRQSDEFYDLVKDLTCHVTVICGHYHVEKVVQRGKLLTLLTPSTFVQIKHEPDELVVDNYRIGIREINLTSHGTNSRVHYVG